MTKYQHCESLARSIGFSLLSLKCLFYYFKESSYNWKLIISSQKVASKNMCFIQSDIICIEKVSNPIYIKYNIINYFLEAHCILSTSLCMHIFCILIISLLLKMFEKTYFEFLLKRENKAQVWVWAEKKYNFE